MIFSSVKCWLKTKQTKSHINLTEHQYSNNVAFVLDNSYLLTYLMELICYSKQAGHCPVFDGIFELDIGFYHI